MANLRPLEDRDLDSLYAISLATGHYGGDASHLYRDGRMMGHIYAAPYAKLTPETCFVVEDAEGVGGFATGTLDTEAFEARLEEDWWPPLRRLYPDPSATPAETWTADQRRSHMIHHPRRTPLAIAGDYPAHLHMNLLPRLQRRGLGSALLRLWLDRVRSSGVTGVHVGLNPQNHGAICFWQASGFDPLQPMSDEIRLWHGRLLSPGPAVES